MLTEIPVDLKDRNFPPLFIMKPGTEFDFGKLENSSLMYLYPPYKKTEEIQSLNKFPEWEFEDENGGRKSTKISKFFYTNRKHRLSQTGGRILNNRMKNNKILKSSDMRFPFKFKIIGFEKLWTVFDCLLYDDKEKISQEMDRNNFMLQPQFLKHVKNKEDAKMDDIISKSLLQRYFEGLDTKLREFWSYYSNFGWNFSSNNAFRILEFDEKNYIPLKFYLKSYLYLGSEKLHKPVYSKKIYYSNSARFDQWVQFGDIRYWDLPRNAKICIDIVLETLEPKSPNYQIQKRLSEIEPRDSNAFDIRKLYSKGIDLYIGSISFNIFDYNGKLKNSDKGFNVWPFYTHDPQLGCMKEYHGVSSKIFQAKRWKRDDWHCKLFLEFQKFPKIVMHSVREKRETIKMDHFELEDIEDTENLEFIQKDTYMKETINKKKVEESEVIYWK